MTQWFPVGGDEVCLLRDGAEAFPAMLEAIGGAKNEVLLEMYWIAPDRCGLRFLDALVAAARRGVRVRVVYDAVGSMEISPGFWSQVIAAGGEVGSFHAIFPLRSALTIDILDGRDHRKILVIDGYLAFTGGINLARQWLSVEDGGDGWRDDMIGVRGEAVNELRTIFYETWKKIGNTPPRDLRAIRRRRTRRVWILANPYRKRRDVRQEYLHRIEFAKTRIDIANSYFVPDRSVRGALIRAAQRGVDVRVLVPEQGDVPIVQYAVEALFDTLLRSGIKVRALTDRVLHAKTALIDDDFVTIGSYNLDERSWRKNLELNVAVEDATFARHVRSWFDHDFEGARKIELESWRERPIARRAAEWIAFGLRRLW
ncbi:phospholipase D-like domain-containing protein [soil metagenome]